MIRNFNNVQINVEFDEAPKRENLKSGESLKTLFGKIKKLFSDLHNVAFTGDYNDLENVPSGSNVNVDDHLDVKSTNSVQNKVITEALDTKLNKSGDEMTGPLIASSNDKYTTAQVRNITMSDSEPAGGVNGQIHFRY